jgi:hypothetical protein
VERIVAPGGAPLTLQSVVLEYMTDRRAATTDHLAINPKVLLLPADSVSLRLTWSIG